MTRYQVLVSARVLAFRDEWRPVEGFRLVSVGREYDPFAQMRVCVFEDDGAPPELEGQMVEIGLERAGGVTRVASRTVAPW